MPSTPRAESAWKAMAGRARAGAGAGEAASAARPAADPPPPGRPTAGLAADAALFDGDPGRAEVRVTASWLLLRDRTRRRLEGR
ncbi:hypothetical protein ACL02U_00175 [Streptomyces sp. MS06]|uniref:hypothetical protein n=1 Tax=Streptomyces sp. MS06 TaxID=3385974 RepID=UPI0039A16FDD